jgi:hypothetical protein
MKFLGREKSATNNTKWHENFVKFVLFVAKKESGGNRLDFSKALAVETRCPEPVEGRVVAIHETGGLRFRGDILVPYFLYFWRSGSKFTRLACRAGRVLSLDVGGF